METRLYESKQETGNCRLELSSVPIPPYQRISLMNFQDRFCIFTFSPLQKL